MTPTSLAAYHLSVANLHAPGKIRTYHLSAALRIAKWMGSQRQRIEAKRLLKDLGAPPA